VSAATNLADLFRRPAAPTTGPLRTDPLTDPLVLSAPTNRTDPAHWAPNAVSEPVYAAVYAAHVDQLAAGLGMPGLAPAAPSVGEAAPPVEDPDPDDDPAALTHLVETLRAVDLGDRADRIAHTPGSHS
jgi:hypothetical protein